MIKYRKYGILIILTGFSGFVQAQTDVDLTKQTVDTNESASHIWFLASDELKGRDTGSPEIDIAASYIAAQFRKYGVLPVTGGSGYYQAVPLEATKPPSQGTLHAGDFSFTIGENLVALQATNITAEHPVLFLEFAMPEELTRENVKGKIIIAKAGKSGESNPRSFFSLSRDKRKAAKENGAVALVELYNSTAFPWSMLLNFLNREQLRLAGNDNETDQDNFGHLWVYDPGNAFYAYLSDNKKIAARIGLTSKERTAVKATNVIGMVEGTDPELKNEYILLSAHYDHIGYKTGTHGEDSIYNGARDNAIGVAAILSAAQGFGKYPPKRSVIFLACTGEEKGLLGSKWFAENPPVALHKIVYNLNIDGGGYNDVTKVSIVGLHRTTAEKHLISAVHDFGLEPIADPAPEQNLFDRSDNVSFAAKGIPAPTFSTGFTSFDEEIMKYYHQVTDEAESLDYDYLAKYFLSYVLAARRIANMEETPFWTKGDKYEEAGRKLYELNK